MDAKGTGRAQAGATLGGQEQAGKMGLPFVLSQCVVLNYVLCQRRGFGEKPKRRCKAGGYAHVSIYSTASISTTQKELMKGGA